MAIIGSLGDTVFCVSRGTVKTLESLKWDSSARYSAHERHLREPLLEFTGPGAESMSFSIILSAWLGVDPMKELANLLIAERSGKALRLVLGTHGYGTNKWVIEKLSNELDRFDGNGELLHVKVTVSLKSYAAR